MQDTDFMHTCVHESLLKMGKISFRDVSGYRTVDGYGDTEVIHIETLCFEHDNSR